MNTSLATTAMLTLYWSGGMLRTRLTQEVGMGDFDPLREHCQLTRRYFFQIGCAAAAA